MQIMIQFEFLKHTFAFNLGVEVIPDVSEMDTEMIKQAKAAAARQQAQGGRMLVLSDDDEDDEDNSPRVVGFVPNEQRYPDDE